MTSDKKKYTFNLDGDRADFTDPHRKRPMKERLREQGVTDFNPKYIVEDLGNGFSQIHIIDDGEKEGREDDR